jgi:integration host factor subunit beta
MLRMPRSKNPVNEKSKVVSKTAPTKAYPKVTLQTSQTSELAPKVKPKTITRLELAQEVAKVVGRMMEITNRDAETVVTEIIQSMVDALQEGNEIEIRNFGSFRLRSRRARKARNPKTGDSVDVPAKQVVFFTMGKNLRHFLKQQ